MGVVLSTGLAVGLLFVIRPTVRDPQTGGRPLLAWTSAVSLQAGFWLLFFFDASPPSPLAVVLVNTLSVGAMTEYVRAVRLFLNLPSRRFLLWSAVLLAAAANVWFAFVQPSFSGRMLVVSLLGSALLLWVSVPLLLSTDGAVARACRLVGGTFLALAATLLVRLGDTVLRPDLPPDQSGPQQWALLAFAILPGFATLGFVLMHAARATAELRKLANTDPLTGALNRRALEAIYPSMMASCTRLGRPVSVLLLDIDHFKRINDAHGHDAGDQTLVAVYRSLAECLRDEDVVARLGGEEFGVLLPGADRKGAIQVAERIRQRIGQMGSAELPAHVALTVTIGVGERRQEGESLQDMITRADRAMFDGKRAGRNRVVART
jgi:diguanylate cyclase (GGDEF)-like protein